MKPRTLITAGPTHEPIDSVRVLANRSSGRLGIALASASASRGWATTLLLGPTHLEPPAIEELRVFRYRSTADLDSLLSRHWPEHDLLIMAAAVADYRPADPAEGKLRREPGGLTLRLEPTPDLLAGCARSRRTGQHLIGFALEPRASLEASARDKLERKGVDMIVANPIETLDSERIEATLVAPSGITRLEPMPKPEFAKTLLDAGVSLFDQDDHP